MVQHTKDWRKTQKCEAYTPRSLMGRTQDYNLKSNMGRHQTTLQLLSKNTKRKASMVWFLLNFEKNWKRHSEAHIFSSLSAPICFQGFIVKTFHLKRPNDPYSLLLVVDLRRSMTMIPKGHMFSPKKTAFKFVQPKNKQPNIKKTNKKSCCCPRCRLSPLP